MSRIGVRSGLAARAISHHRNYALIGTATTGNLPVRMWVIAYTKRIICQERKRT